MSNIADSLNNYWNTASKPIKEALTTHTGDSDVHVTAAQKTAWSGKQDAPASAGTEGQVLMLDSNGKPVWGDVSSGSSLALSRIYIATAPTKTAYKAGETFDPTGMVVKADYALDGHTVVEGATITGYSEALQVQEAGRSSPGVPQSAPVRNADRRADAAHRERHDRFLCERRLL